MEAPERRRLFDRGVQRFNDRCFYEAHEDWETLWHESDGAERRWLQGLIQVAAAFFHFERGFHASGFVKLVRQGLDKALPFPEATYGLSGKAYEEHIGPWRAHAEAVAAGAPLCEGAPEVLPRLEYERDARPDPLPEEDEP